MISQSRDIWYIIWQDFHLFYISHYGQPTYGFEVFNPRTIPEGFDFLSMQNWSFFESTSPSWSITSSQELQLIGIFDPNFTFISFKSSILFTRFSHSEPSESNEKARLVESSDFPTESFPCGRIPEGLETFLVDLWNCVQCICLLAHKWDGCQCQSRFLLCFTNFIFKFIMNFEQTTFDLPW